jgi:HlyD family secretion protein
MASGGLTGSPRSASSWSRSVPADIGCRALNRRRRSSASCARPRSASRPGQLAAIKVHKGDTVRAGDVVAELSAIELSASVGQARAALAAATADRNNVYAGVRAEQIASRAAEIAKAKSRLEYAEQQLNRTTYLARSETASQQALDQAENDVASARADVAEAQANHDAAVAGPTKEERAIADAQVKAAASALAVLERRLDKTILGAPADGIVSVIVAEVGENVHAGQSVLVIEVTGKQWLSFNAREDLLHGLTVGAKVNVGRAGAPCRPFVLARQWRPRYLPLRNHPRLKGRSHRG